MVQSSSTIDDHSEGIERACRLAGASTCQIAKGRRLGHAIFPDRPSCGLDADGKRALSVIMALVRALIAVLVSLLTIGAVVAIKRGTEWELRGASDTTLDVTLSATVLFALVAVAWTYLLRPRLPRRGQERQDAGLSHISV